MTNNHLNIKTSIRRRIRSVFGWAFVVAGVIWRILTLDWPSPTMRSSARTSLVIVLLVVSLLAILIFVPKWQASRSKGANAQNEFERENEARKTLAQIIGGLILLIGAYGTVRSLQISQQGQLTDRFTKAIEQLGATHNDGAPKLEVRLGAIYAIERIAKDSDRDYWPVMEVLAAYVRENSVYTKPEQGKDNEQQPNMTPRPQVRLDIDAILSVLARRERQQLIEPLRLTETDLHKISVSFGDLAGVDFSRSDLSETILYRCDLHNANFTKAHLRGAIIYEANLHEALFQYANLQSASFPGSNLHHADLHGADLRGADFISADLTEAGLFDANLEGTMLYNADLRGARHLAQQQVNLAQGNKNTRLPDGITRPDSWNDN